MSIAQRHMIEVYGMTKFERGSALASSLAYQRALLKQARQYLKEKKSVFAQLEIKAWKVEHRAYKLALKWQLESK